MTEITLFGGPYDGRVEILQDFYDVGGVTSRRDGWPLILEFRNYVGERPSTEVIATGGRVNEGRLVARYQLTEDVTSDGRQVYQHIPN